MSKVDDPLARAQHTKEIIKRLRTDIILGKYESGSRLIEAKIADQLGTSRAPIRTAFQLLAQEGLVLNLSNGGTEVVGFSVKQAVDLYDLRLLLERRALELVLQNKTFHFRPIFESMEQMEAHLGADNEDQEVSSSETSQLDIQFHRNLVIMSENNPLLVAWNTMANVFQAILEITNTSTLTYREFYDGHRRLADLIIQKNESCIDELTRHLTHAKGIIVSRLETNLKKA